MPKTIEFRSVATAPKSERPAIVDMPIEALIAAIRAGKPVAK